MRYLLAALNAKYIHSNLGIYSLKAYAQKRHPSAEILLGEYTINHQPGDILADIYRKKPDFLGFSCYIWNVETVRRAAGSGSSPAFRGWFSARKAGKS